MGLIERLLELVIDPGLPIYPDEPTGGFCRFVLELDGPAFLITGTAYFPTDVVYAIRTLTAEEIKSLTK